MGKPSRFLIGIKLQFLCGLLIILLGKLALCSEYTGDSTSGDSEPGFIEIEAQPVITNRLEGTYKLLPYSDRRQRWSTVAALGVDMFEPTNYEPNFITDTFSSVYAVEGPNMPNFTIEVKRNTFLGGMGIEFGAAFMSMKSEPYPSSTATDIIKSSLSATAFRLGLRLTLDKLFSEPYMAPYASGGVYTINYSESLASTAVNGFTEASWYYSAGVMLQLNWLVPREAQQAYYGAGIENTFLYVEVKQYGPSQSEKDPDFSTDPFFGGGFAIEL